MKVLFIGHYREKGGWAQAARDYILALNRAGVDVVCRNVTLTSNNEISPELEKLESKDTSDCDYCIQHVLPHHLVKTNKYKKNVALVALESTTIKHHPWLEYLKLVDEVWVPNRDSKSFLVDDIKNKIRVVPHCFDLEKYNKDYPPVNIPHLNNKFKFYYIGDINDRKNIRSIIRCFHSEFHPSEQACLILKVKKFGLSSEQTSALMNNLIAEEKLKLRIYPDISMYSRDIVISDDIREDQIYGLHKYCDCFISPSHGEAWSIPAFDAMAFGNTPICSMFGGPRDYISPDDKMTGTAVNGTYSVCTCSDSAFPDLFTGKEFWFQPSEMSIRSAMRFYFENRNKDLAKKSGLNMAKNFSYENVANLIKGYLSE